MQKGSILLILTLLVLCYSKHCCQFFDEKPYHVASDKDCLEIDRRFMYVAHWNVSDSETCRYLAKVCVYGSYNQKEKCGMTCLDDSKDFCPTMLLQNCKLASQWYTPSCYQNLMVIHKFIQK